jgi:hypothetical protein
LELTVNLPALPPTDKPTDPLFRFKFTPFAILMVFLALIPMLSALLSEIKKNGLPF